MSAKEKILLLILSSIQFVHIVDFMIIMPLGPEFREAFDLDPTLFIFIVAAYTLSAGISSLAAAFFIDRFDRKKALAFCFAGCSIATIGCGLAPDFIELMLARALAGAFGGVLVALVNAIVADQFPEERRGAAMGILMAAFSVASVVGLPAGLYLSAVFNWQMPFLVLGVLGLVLLVAAWFIVPSMRGHMQRAADRPTPIDVMQRLFQNPNQLRALLFMIFIMIGQFSVIPLISDYLVHNQGFNKNEITLVYLFGGLATMISLPLIGKLADRIGKPLTFVIAASISIIPLAMITDLPEIPIWGIYAVTVGFFVFISGRAVPAMAMATSTALPQNRGSLMSFVISVRQLAAGVAALITGTLVTQTEEMALVDYHLVGYLAIGSTILAMLFAFRIKVVDAGIKPVN